MSRLSRIVLRRAALAIAAALAALLVAGCGAPAKDQWQALGPGNGIIVLSLAADPFTPQLVYAGTSSGVYLTRSDAGAAIQPTSGPPKNVVVDAVLPDPRVQGTIYAGTSAGLYVSPHYGDSWQPRGAGFPRDDTMDALAVGSDATTLFAGSLQHGVYVSHDTGSTWQPAGSGLPYAANINALLFERSTGQLLAAVDQHGVFASTDAGQTWSARSSGLAQGVDVLSLVRLDAPTGSLLLAGTSAGLYASADVAAHWAPFASTQIQGRVLALATDPTSSSVLYIGVSDASGNAVMQSRDAGQHWTSVAKGISHQVSAVLAVRDHTGAASVLYAGQGDLARFPPSSTGTPGPGTFIADGLFLLAMLALMYWIYRRTRRYRYGPVHLASGQAGGGDAGPASTGVRQTAPPSDSPSHNGRAPAPPARTSTPQAPGPRPELDDTRN